MTMHMIRLISACLVFTADAQQPKGADLAPVAQWEGIGHTVSGTFAEKDGSLELLDFTYNKQAPALFIYVWDETHVKELNGKKTKTETDALKAFTKEKSKVDTLLKRDQATDVWTDDEDVEVPQPLKINLDKFEFLSRRSEADKETEQLYLVLWCDEHHVPFAKAKISNAWIPSSSVSDNKDETLTANPENESTEEITSTVDENDTNGNVVADAVTKDVEDETNEAASSSDADASALETKAGEYSMVKENVLITANNNRKGEFELQAATKKIMLSYNRGNVYCTRGNDEECKFGKWGIIGAKKSFVVLKKIGAENEIITAENETGMNNKDELVFEGDFTAGKYQVLFNADQLDVNNPHNTAFITLSVRVPTNPENKSTEVANATDAGTNVNVVDDASPSSSDKIVIGEATTVKNDETKDNKDETLTDNKDETLAVANATDAGTNVNVVDVANATDAGTNVNVVDDNKDETLTVEESAETTENLLDASPSTAIIVADDQTDANELVNAGTDGKEAFPAPAPAAIPTTDAQQGSDSNSSPPESSSSDVVCADYTSTEAGQAAEDRKKCTDKGCTSVKGWVWGITCS